MTPEDALQFWHSRADFERKPAQVSELKLDRIRELLDRLGNPQNNLRIVHIAGSKGKGSTSAMFAAVAQAAGLRTGLFTSPHLVDVSERIQIDRTPISRGDLARLLTDIRPIVADMDTTGNAPTFFEICTALGFLHFAQSGVELAIIEVGLGGRFDSTNVCQPVVSVITSISYEHTDILGKQLHQIAFEKGGVIKPGRPVVSGVTVLEAAQVIRTLASERGSPLIEFERDFQLSYQPGKITSLGEVSPARITVQQNGHSHGPYDLALFGRHQAENASLVIAATEILRGSGIAIDETALRHGLAHVAWPARMEPFPGTPIVVLDCAHNVASAKVLIDTLHESFPLGKRALVFAASNDKDIDGIMAEFADQFDYFVFTRYHDNPRSLPVQRLLDALLAVAPKAAMIVADGPAEALTEAKRVQPAMIVVAGSVFLAGEIRPTLLASQRNCL